jgi:hypothetical protein
MIYVMCPYQSVSGGPELAHQFCYIANLIAQKEIAKICYIDTSSDDCISSRSVDAPAPTAYHKYETHHATTPGEVDCEGNIVIVPEGLTCQIQELLRSTICLWWMSVDNYKLATNEVDLPLLRKKVHHHLLQSQYAKEYVLQNFTTPSLFWLTDYINTEHGTFLYPADLRNDVAPYNPKKGYQTLEKVMENVNWIKWIPLYNLTIEDEIILMQSSKIYVDFGHHPGKDRIPREAAVNGCCVITNREGSAAYHEDVPIPSEYKYAHPLSELDSIDALMKDICQNFPQHQAQFASYRSWIKGETDRFMDEVAHLLSSLHIL